MNTMAKWMGTIVSTVFFSLAEAQILKAPAKEMEKPKLAVPARKVSAPNSVSKIVFPAMSDTKKASGWKLF